MSPYNIVLFLAATLLLIHCTAVQGELGLQTNPGVAISAIEGRMTERAVEAAELLRSKRYAWVYPYDWRWGYYRWGPWRSLGWPYGWEYYPWLS